MEEFTVKAFQSDRQSTCINRLQKYDRYIFQVDQLSKEVIPNGWHLVVCCNSSRPIDSPNLQWVCSSCDVLLDVSQSLFGISSFESTGSGPIIWSSLYPLLNILSNIWRWWSYQSFSCLFFRLNAKLSCFPRHDFVAFHAVVHLPGNGFSIHFVL